MIGAMLRDFRAGRYFRRRAKRSAEGLQPLVDEVRAAIERDLEEVKTALSSHPSVPPICHRGHGPMILRRTMRPSPSGSPYSWRCSDCEGTEPLSDEQRAYLRATGLLSGPVAMTNFDLPERAESLLLPDRRR
jgi:hypothetical protein